MTINIRNAISRTSSGQSNAFPRTCSCHRKYLNSNHSLCAGLGWLLRPSQIVSRCFAAMFSAVATVYSLVRFLVAVRVDGLRRGFQVRLHKAEFHVEQLAGGRPFAAGGVESSLR